jgi:hypothetical protein
MLAELSVAADIADVVYTADGENIVVGERSGTLFQVDADTLEPSSAQVRLHHPIAGSSPVPTDARHWFCTRVSGSRPSTWQVAVFSTPGTWDSAPSTPTSRPTAGWSRSSARAVRWECSTSNPGGG